MAESAKSCLHELHLELGARMTHYGGYEMPLFYKAGAIAEHLHTRTYASLFDVSHMVQLRVRGAQSAVELEKLMPADVCGLSMHRQLYSVLTNDSGGVIDDLMMSRRADCDYHLVLNATRRHPDLEYLRHVLPDSIETSCQAGQGLVALQGPSSADIMSEWIDDLDELSFMSSTFASISGVDCYVIRCGYSGEDGFEISAPVDQMDVVARALLAHPESMPAGLAARDSLRLEAGLCLYGQELNEQTTPVEAGLYWVIAPARRENGIRRGGFPGADVVLNQADGALPRRRVGCLLSGRLPARTGAKLYAPGGGPVGEVSSGAFSPTLGVAVAMAYVDSEYATTEAELRVDIRGKLHPVMLGELPMVAHRYYRGER